MGGILRLQPCGVSDLCFESEFFEGALRAANGLERFSNGPGETDAAQ